MMTIAPLQYVVLQVQDVRFTEEILPVLTDMQQAGNVRVVDVRFVAKNAAGLGQGARSESRPLVEGESV